MLFLAGERALLPPQLAGTPIALERLEHVGLLDDLALFAARLLGELVLFGFRRLRAARSRRTGLRTCGGRSFDSTRTHPAGRRCRRLLEIDAAEHADLLRLVVPTCRRDRGFGGNILVFALF